MNHVTHLLQIRHYVHNGIIIYIQNSPPEKSLIKTKTLLTIAEMWIFFLQDERVMLAVSHKFHTLTGR